MQHNLLRLSKIYNLFFCYSLMIKYYYYTVYHIMYAYYTVYKLMHRLFKFSLPSFWWLDVQPFSYPSAPEWHTSATIRRDCLSRWHWTWASPCKCWPSPRGCYWPREPVWTRPWPWRSWRTAPSRRPCCSINIAGQWCWRRPARDSSTPGWCRRMCS